MCNAPDRTLGRRLTRSGSGTASDLVSGATRGENRHEYALLSSTLLLLLTLLFGTDPRHWESIITPRSWRRYSMVDHSFCYTCVLPSRYIPTWIDPVLRRDYAGGWQIGSEDWRVGHGPILP